MSVDRGTVHPLGGGNVFLIQTRLESGLDSDAQTCLDVRVMLSFSWKCLEWWGRDHAWPFRAAPGWGSALRRGALRSEPRLQTRHVT